MRAIVIMDLTKHDSPNPYAAPSTSPDNLRSQRLDDEEQIRAHHLKHEASIRSIGSLYILGGIGALITGFSILSIILAEGFQDLRPQSVAISLGLILLGTGLIVLAAGLRRLAPWARWPTIILSGIGLLGFPVGTLINAYILYLVASEKGRFILSWDYRAIVERTPHLRYRSNAGLVLLILLAILVVGLFVLFAFVRS